MKERKRKALKEEMKKLWRNTAILLFLLVALVIGLSLASGEGRLMLFRRVGWILMSVAMFIFGLVIGIKSMTRLKSSRFFTKEEIEEGEDGVTL